MLLTGAVAHVGWKGEAFVYYMGYLISGFLTAGRITLEVVVCDADLSLLEMAFCGFLFPLLTGGGFSIRLSIRHLAVCFLAEWALVQQICLGN